MQKSDWVALPKNRAEAKRTGAKYYFTGVPCKHGHVAPRKTKGICVECMRLEGQKANVTRAEYFRAYNKSEAGLAAKQRYYEANKELVVSRAHDTDVELKRQYKKQYKQTHKIATLVDNQMYKRRVRFVTPRWLSKEQRQQIREVYKLAMQMTKTTGEKYTVDHIVPLRSDVVCGLHVPWNLRVVTHAENARKGNKIDVT